VLRQTVRLVSMTLNPNFQTLKVGINLAQWLFH